MLPMKLEGRMLGISLASRSPLTLPLVVAETDCEELVVDEVSREPVAAVGCDSPVVEGAVGPFVGK